MSGETTSSLVNESSLQAQRRERVQQRWRVVLPAFVRLGLIFALALLLGIFVGERAGLWFALICLTFLLVFHLFFLSALGVWLERPSLAEIPNGAGAWSEIFTRLYRARRASEQSERRLVENEARFRRTISALPEGIVLVDASFQIEWCNPVAERHLAISLRGDAGLRLTNLVRDPMFVAYITSGNFEQPLVFRPLSNPALALAVGVIEFEAGRFIVITRDVTQSERVDAMRRDFVANVSHELRTPLTVVNGFLETLLDAQPPLEGTRLHHVQLMSEQAQRMSRLVEDLLMLSRLESQENALVEEDVDMSRLLAELAQEARALSNGKHQISMDSAPARVRGSRDELRSALSNLVSNAIRYTPAGGRIQLRWLTTADGAEFEVQDTGIGIAPEHIPRLTERFYRVDKSRSRETGGTGLGLAIVKHVLLRHQASLQIASELGQGSTFAVEFPATRVVEPAQQSVAA